MYREKVPQSSPCGLPACCPSHTSRVCHPPFREDIKLADQHQVNSIIATVFAMLAKITQTDWIQGAKQIAKCIIEALTDAGLKIVPASEIDRTC